MKQRYWNDLTDEERQKLENEWRSSEWYARAKADAKPKKNSGEQIAYSVIGFIGIVWTIIAIASASSAESNGGDSGISIIFVVIGFFIAFGGVYGIWYGDIESVNKQIEKEAEKWLLEKYNIKM